MPGGLTPELKIGLDDYSREGRTPEESVTFLKDVLLHRYGPDYTIELFDYMTPAAGDDFAEGVIMEIYRVVRMNNPGDYDRSDMMQRLEKREILERTNFYFVSRIFELSEEEREKLDPEVLAHADKKVRLYREKMAKSFSDFLGGEVIRFTELVSLAKIERSSVPVSGFQATVEHLSHFEDIGTASEGCGFWGTISAFEGNTLDDVYYSSLRLERDVILGGDVLSGEKPVPYKVRVIIIAGQDNNYHANREKNLNIEFDVDGDRRSDYSLTFDTNGNLVKVEVPFELTRDLGLEEWSHGLWYADPSRLVDFVHLEEPKKIDLMLAIAENLGKAGINVDAFLQGAKGKWADVFNSLLALDESDAVIKAAEGKPLGAASLVLKPQFLN
ncbi:hypothetical protein A3H26_00430 [candidate division WWE3 bacterium RIFCSPLOWO2_12_FULL_36_10]|uniref:Uncharacterized protein n=1 Tax=candidate division WWE3 bacterium RIFCSPLOWO2_12_FULL_36_10 TaxID=1802630 RepID=A0A1F4VH65_UNCKA|nr:MAG: hypothetical protein A3H26_00430 [candidate division WWE3 bacterium RIFCSPLOWO2_12_FULL_36_10]